MKIRLLIITLIILLSYSVGYTRVEYKVYIPLTSVTECNYPHAKIDSRGNCTNIGEPIKFP
jgi:hypothetical protein